MATDMSGGPGAFRRLMNKVARWSQALDYSGIDYTFDRLAFIERDMAVAKRRLHGGLGVAARLAGVDSVQ